MIAISSADIAIAEALSAAAPNGKLQIVARQSRFGGLFYSIEDDRGIIEAYSTSIEVYDRIDAIKARLRRA